MEGEDVAAPAAAIAPGIITADRNGTAAAPPPDPGGKAQQPLPQEDFFAATAEMDEICKDLPAGGEGSNYKDVVLRIEFISSREVKAIISLTVIVIGAGVAITVYGKDNFLSGTVCIGITGLLLLLYLAAGLMLWLRRQRWDARRFRSYLTRMTELVAMLLLVAAWTVAGDGRRLERDCPNTCSNLLLCLFTITARGMTLWRGGPLTRWQHMGVALDKLARATRRWVVRRAREEEAARRLLQERFREEWRKNARDGAKQFRETAGAVPNARAAAGA
eukprot:XP_001692592.1 predicted protein [Chlamydomonas reinhardtii]